MRETIHYRLTFYSKWHCGSGLAAGANADALVVRDENGLPYIPGKTLKGFIRQAVEEMAFFENQAPDVIQLFGAPFTNKAETFFSNATLIEHDAILADGLTEGLFSFISQTRLTPEGIADKGSLRRIEVVVPCTLEGYIYNVDTSQKDYIIHALPYIKAIGYHRNRGLGRCCIKPKLED